MSVLTWLGNNGLGGVGDAVGCRGLQLDLVVVAVALGEQVCNTSGGINLINKQRSENKKLVRTLKRRKIHVASRVVVPRRR